MIINMSGGGVDTSNVTAAAGDVLSGKVIVDKDGNEITGNIPSPVASSNITLTSSDNRKVIVGKDDIGTGGFWVTTNSDGNIRLCTAIPKTGFYTEANQIIGVPVNTQGSKTVTPTESAQTVVSSGRYTTGEVTVAPIPSNYYALNFNVVGGTSAPSNPSENTIWVNTSTPITSWDISATEPNVYNIQPSVSTDPWCLVAPCVLYEGDIVNFTIPSTATSTFEAIRIVDKAYRTYYVRTNGGAGTAWSAGTKVGVKISNTSIPVGSWGSDGGTANIIAWDKYYHKNGDVWIITGTSSTIAFNALKKNGIQIYPISAKQYVNGAFVNIEAMSYQSGRWHDWIAYLYNYGDENSSFTGGWITEGYLFGEATPGTPTPLILTKESGSMLITNNFTHAWDNRSGIARPANTIDLTNYSALKLYYDCSLPDCTAGFGVLPVGTTYWQFGWVASYNFNNATTTGASITLDVSALTGKYNICVAIFSWAANNWIRIHKLELL